MTGLRQAAVPYVFMRLSVDNRIPYRSEGPSRRKARGVTIVEVVIVAVIGAILAITAAVSYAPKSVNLVAEADRIRYDLRLMQSMAMAWGAPLRVTFSATGYSFLCLQTVSPACVASSAPAAGAFSGLQAVTFDAQLESGIAFDGTMGAGNFTNTLDYDSLGRPATSCDSTCSRRTTAFTIQLSGGGSTRTVTVDPISGLPY